MNLFVLIILFLIAAAFFISVLYFLILRPMASKQAVTRIESMQQVDKDDSETESQDQILHEDVLSDNPTLNQILRKTPWMFDLHLFVKQSALGISVANLIAFSLIPAIVVLLIGLLGSNNLLVVILIAAGIGYIPFFIVSSYRKSRFKRFEELLPEAIDLLARSARAGHTFISGMELISDEMSEPLSSEFRRVFDQQNLGLPIKDALRNLALRVPLPDVRIFVTTLIFQHETGGKLAEILSTLAEVIRERFRLMRHIQGVTAQGRLSRNILMAVPVGMGLLMYLKNPEYIMMLFTDPRGKFMFYAAVAAQIIGFFVLQKIIKPKV